MALDGNSKKDSLLRNQSFPLEYTVNTKMPYFDLKIDPTIKDDTLNQQNDESSDIKNVKMVETSEIIAKNACSNSVTNDNTTVVS